MYGSRQKWFSKILETMPDTEDCINPPFPKSGEKYFRIGFGSNRFIATHKVIEKFIGPLEGLWALHHCDNSWCINPKHLYRGTHYDNVRDRNERGRTLKGSEVSNSKLTEDQVKEIRLRFENGETQTSISEDYEVSQVMISKIVRREWWRHV